MALILHQWVSDLEWNIKEKTDYVAVVLINNLINRIYPSQCLLFSPIIKVLPEHMMVKQKIC